jgi:hypothetical protein
MPPHDIEEDVVEVILATASRRGSGVSLKRFGASFTLVGRWQRHWLDVVVHMAWINAGEGREGWQDKLGVVVGQGGRAQGDRRGARVDVWGHGKREGERQQAAASVQLWGDCSWALRAGGEVCERCV